MRMPFICLVLITLCLSLMSSDKVLVSGQCYDQKVLLIELKESLLFDDSLSTKLVTWYLKSDAWDGVECKNGHVVGLDLSNEWITGIRSSSVLFGMQYLEKLNLAFNRFNSSEIPLGFGNLSNLVYLNLSNTGFTGQIPLKISQLTRLEILDLSTDFFFGLNSLKLINPNLKILVENLKELRELYLDGVNISANGTEWCNALSSSSLQNLQVLSLFSCQLSGPIDSSLLKFRSLSVIQLSGNNLSSVPRFIANFSNLTVLKLGGCGLNGEFPSKIFKLTTLRIIDLSYNPFLRGSLPEIPENSSLQTLVLSFTNFSGTLPSSIGNLNNLSRIELASCNFGGTIPSTMANLSQLAYLDFSRNKFIGQVPSFTLSRNLTQLMMPSNSLNGSITTIHWERLQNLVNIDMRNNSLRGSISKSLFTLPIIQEIQLANNLFTGQLNGFLATFSYALGTLDLSGNGLDGPISSIIQLKGLHFLSLASNNFSGSFHIGALQQLKNLSSLDLSYNNLLISGTDDNAIPSQFTTVRLASCHLRAIPRFLQNQYGLINLDLSDNHIQGAIPPWIWGLESLEYLNLSANLLQEIEPTLLIQNSSISILDLHSNRLQGQTLPLPTYAVYLDYSNNSFNLVISDNIGEKLQVTVFLSLSKNNFTGSIPRSICISTYLEVIDLSHNNLNGSIPDCLEDMGLLKVLNLRNNHLQGSIPEIPSGLKTLDLNGNHLEGELPASLGSWTVLEVLDVGNNHISGPFPCRLKRITTLRVLVLRSNQFNGKLGCTMVEGNWKMLQIIDVSANNFSGELPGKFLSTWEAMKTNGGFNYLQYPFLKLSNLYYQDRVSVTGKGSNLDLARILTSFTAVDFSSNNFEGPIPEGLGDFRALHFLNLSHNALSGPVMSGLGNLQQLESLDLSNNKLRGKIPEQLSQLTFLSYLNLSYNQLVGRIPDTRQFSTFSEDSYLGNSGLCGPPLQESCAVSSANSTPGKNGSSQARYNWHFISTELGFIVGFALVVAYITLLPRGQIWSNDLVEKLLKKILPLLGLSRK